MTSHQDIAQAFQAAMDYEKQSRESPENCDSSNHAAAKFCEAADLSDQLAMSSEATNTEKRLLLIYSTYYRSQAHKAMMNFHYCRHNVDAAMKEANYTKELLAKTISEGKAAAEITLLDQSNRERIKKNLVTWNFESITHEAKFSSIEARQKWDEGQWLDALDLYRRAAKKEKAALDYIKGHDIDPKMERVTRGNYFAVLANISQSLALLALDRHNPININRSNFLKVLEYTYEAYEIGQYASRENPEWKEHQDVSQQCRKNIENFLEQHRDSWLQAYIHFENKPEFLKIMSQTDLSLFKKIEQQRHIRENKAFQTWAIGSFWLFVLVIIVAVVLIVFTKFSFWIGIGLVIVMEAIFIIIGAFILRTTGDLTEKGLVRLVRLAFKFQFKFFSAS
jgi:hypothetical protein